MKCKPHGTHCDTPPQYIVVWGCYHHINEFVTCKPHLLEWIKDFWRRQIHCYNCATNHNPCEAQEYLVELTDKLTKQAETLFP